MKEIGIVTKNNNFNPNETFFGEKGQYINLITRFPEDYHQYFDRGKCILRICSVNVTRQVLIFWGKATLYKCTKEKLRVDCNGKKSQNTWNHSSVGGGNLVNILYRQIFASKKGPPGGCHWSAVSQCLRIPQNVSIQNLQFLPKMYLFCLFILLLEWFIIGRWNLQK